MVIWLPSAILCPQKPTGFEAFGGINPTMQEGLCGAPFAQTRTGNVVGFFHLASGDYAECAAMDGLIVEGYGVV